MLIHFDKTKRFCSAIIAALFFINACIPVAHAQVAFLPDEHHMLAMTDKFSPLSIKGIQFYPDNAFKFNFILDGGQEDLSSDEMKNEGQRLIAYFLAGLTVPEKDLWVNLSPFESKRIIASNVGETEMGKVFLAQDYLLKQIMASALYPEKDLGKAFWQNIYAEAVKKYGTTDIPINTFNKIWIVPNKAVIYGNTSMNAVFVAESSLKVMLEQDYVAQQHDRSGALVAPETNTPTTDNLSSAVIQEIVIPAITREVNEGRNFSGLRQVYNALILAKWYKNNLKESLLAKGYVDRNKITGVDTADKDIVAKVYEQYLRTYKTGAFNFIKEESDPATGEIIPRKYFSGGLNIDIQLTTTSDGAMISLLKPFLMAVTLAITILLTPAVSNTSIAVPGHQGTYIVESGDSPAGIAAHKLNITYPQMIQMMQKGKVAKGDGTLIKNEIQARGLLVGERIIFDLNSTSAGAAGHLTTATTPKPAINIRPTADALSNNLVAVVTNNPMTSIAYQTYSHSQKPVNTLATRRIKQQRLIVNKLAEIGYQIPGQQNAKYILGFKQIKGQYEVIIIKNPADARPVDPTPDFQQLSRFFPDLKNYTPANISALGNGGLVRTGYALPLASDDTPSTHIENLISQVKHYFASSPSAPAYKPLPEPNNYAQFADFILRGAYATSPTSVNRIVDRDMEQFTPSREDTKADVGGIDLEKTIIEGKAEGIKTGFDAPTQLHMLLNADGLTPVINGLAALSLSAVHTLLEIH